MKSLLDGLNNGLEMSEERFSGLEDRLIRIIHSTQRKNIGKNEQNLQPTELWDSIRQSNICMIGILEAE